MSKEVEFKEVEEVEEDDYNSALSAIFMSVWIGIILLIAFNLDKIVDVIDLFILP